MQCPHHVELTLLGSIELLNRAGDRAGSVLQQPKRFALLAFIAAEGAVSRDRILGLFWPELPEDRARAALSQALYIIEDRLQTRVVRRDGDMVSLDCDAVRCDVVVFLSLFEQGRFADAARRWAGDFMPGFIPDSNELDAWLEQTRAGLRRAAAEACWQAATAAEAHAPGDALAFARQSVDIAMDDEHRVREAMSLMQRLGDTAGALGTYEKLRRRMHEELGAEPAAATRALAESIRGPAPATVTPHGPVTAPAAVDESAAGTSPTAGDAASPNGSPWRIPLRRAASAVRPVFASSLVTVTVLALWGWHRDRTVPAPPVDSRVTLLVEPVDGVDSLAAAATLQLAGALQRSDDYRVIIDHSAEAPLSIEATESRSSAPVYAVRATIAGGSGSYRMSAVLMDAVTGDVVQNLDVQAGTAPHASIEDATHAAARAARLALGRRLAVTPRQGSPPHPPGWLAAQHDRIRADSLLQAGAADAALALYRSAQAQLAEAGSTDAEAIALRAELAMDESWTHLREGRRDDAHFAAAQARRLAGNGLDEDAARAATLRGLAGYWWVMTAPAPVLEDSTHVLSETTALLKQATGYAPAAARAWASLATLHAMQGDFGAAYAAATRARMFDAFLRYEGGITATLFDAALEIGDTANARHWCHAMAATDPDYAGSYCELMMLAHETKPSRRDAQRAAGLAASELLDSVTRTRLLVVAGVVQARAGDHAAARAALDVATENVSVDPELLHFTAWLRAELDEPTLAASQLQAFIAENPTVRRGLLMRRRFEHIRSSVPLAQAR